MRSFDYCRMGVTAFAAASLFFVPALPASATQTKSAKREAAQSQFARAEEQRAALNHKPLAERSLADYKRIVSNYRRVYLITPHAAEVQDALLAVAELNAEMGDRFGRGYYQAAVDAYQFLVREYPKSRYCPDALLRTARLEKDQLGEPALATKTYDEFLKRYPRSPRRREAQEGLAELALLQNGGASSPRDAASKKQANDAATRAARNSERARNEEPAPALPGASSGIPRVQRVSATAAAGSTRILIDLEDKVAYSSARIKNPDRIYFDLHAARLTPEVANRNIRVTGDLLKAIRVSQNQAGVVRVVFDVEGVEDYTATLSNQPPRLIVDLYGSSATLRAAKKPASEEQPANKGSNETESRASDTVAERIAVEPTTAKRTLPEPEPATTRPVTKAEAKKAAAARDPLPVNNTSLLRKGRNTTNGSGRSPAAQPTRDGQATLTRALGLKIGRIVIDAGHGGHDTGTIGPSGLMEKDLCLDVALRLGKVIEQRLPGAEVVFTRSDDSFIPLERRTEIANETKADLFLSIHANSSRDHAARGVETYYLNLKGTPEAMDVAARENATANGGVHELQDLVRKIARTEKIEESRELAEDIQDSLTRRIQKSGRNAKNRGVRKAPFVVLIGADMPSILTEISFLSNPADEQMLKKPEYRQRVAEGLYQGVVSYLQSLNSVTYNLPARNSTTRPPAANASVESSRNQQ